SAGGARNGRITSCNWSDFPWRSRVVCSDAAHLLKNNCGGTGSGANSPRNPCPDTNPDILSPKLRASGESGPRRSLHSSRVRTRRRGGIRTALHHSARLSHAVRPRQGGELARDGRKMYPHLPERHRVVWARYEGTHRCWRPL